MRNRYPAYFITTFVAASTFTVSAYAQKMSVAKPASSVAINLSAFSQPPQPVQLIGLQLDANGAIQYQTLMPLAGRVIAVGDASKQRGSGAPLNGVCIYRATVDQQGQPGGGTSLVVGERDSRVKIASETPVEWAVWDVASKDGPSRLPYGGDYSQLPAVAQPTSSIRQMALATDMAGFKQETSRSYPIYKQETRQFDPTSFQFQTRQEEITPQKDVNQAKLARYIAAEGESVSARGQVIRLSPSRYEGLVTPYVDGDKNAAARAVSLLSFDDAGTLLNEQKVSFPYNRKLIARTPVYDPSGKVVGTFTVFGDGMGKKEARDPQGNRFSVVVTDEKGGIWSQFDWINGEGSSRAIIPTYVLRQSDKLAVYSANQQKLLKPVEETWLFDKAGSARLISSMPYQEVAAHSSMIGLVNGGRTSGSDGWFNHANASFVDSFVDGSGDTWLVLQRQAEGPARTVTAQAAPVPGVAKGLMNFANKLNTMAGQPAASAPTTQTVLQKGTTYTDLFVLQFDKDLTLKKQTVVAGEPATEPIRFVRSSRPTGTDYVFNNSVTTHFQIKDGALTVDRLLPTDGIQPGSADVNNFLLDEKAGKVYVLCRMPKKGEQAQLLIYPLD